MECSHVGTEIAWDLHQEQVWGCEKSQSIFQNFQGFWKKKDDIIS